jgi:cell division protease FtsH
MPTFRLRDDLSAEEMTRLNTRRKHVAYHEAGHAVIGLRLGFVVRKVTIKPRALTLGNVEAKVGEASSNRCVDRDAADIKFALAGPLAEQLVSPDPFDVLIANGSGKDWRCAKRTARQLNTQREAEVLIVMLALETKTLVEEHKDAIVRVATALLERETLTGDDLRSLIDGRQG